jgi:hypothetical protein
MHKRHSKKVDDGLKSIGDSDFETFDKYFWADELTDQLIEQLLVEGMPKKDLLVFQARGARYWRPSKSFVFPPEPL